MTKHTLSIIVIVAVLLLAFGVGISTGAQASDTLVIDDGPELRLLPTEIEVVSQVGGSVRGVAVRGDYVYLSVGYRVIALNISNPADAKVAARTEALPGRVGGVALAGHYAFVVDESYGLHIFDLQSQPTMLEVGSWATPGAAKDVFVSGGYAYVADGAGGLACHRHIQPH